MNVLVADDDSTLRMLIRELLQSNLGYEVSEAPDGLEAWQFLQTMPAPDLCILDVRMPKIDGLDLLARLRSDLRFRHQKVILCSTINERATVVRAASLGIDGYLLKPFYAESFLEQTRLVCERQPKETPLRIQLPDPVVLKRLGIEKIVFFDLLNIFSTDLASLITEFSAPLADLDPTDVGLRLSALQGSALSLGLESLAAALTKLERAFVTRDTPSITRGVEILKLASVQITAAAKQAKSPATEPQLG